MRDATVRHTPESILVCVGGREEKEGRRRRGEER